MSCVKPISGYLSGYANPSGKKRIVFNPAASIDGKRIPIPCGRCIGCKLGKSRDWAIRAMHEAQMHDENCFITLTYDDKNLPPDQSLHKSHFQNFMKKLRNEYPNKKIRYLMCGEYGSENLRAHYHALLFGIDFEDRYQHVYTGDPLSGIARNHRPIGNTFHSEELDELWGKGFCHVGELNIRTAAYTARYSMKKINGPMAEKINPETGLKHYERNHLHTGDIVEILPEYLQASLRPGIGAEFYEKYKKDMFPGDTIYLGTHHDAAKKARPVFVKPPKYYEKLLERERPDMLEFVKENRLAYAETHPEAFVDERLIAREVILNERTGQLKRQL